MVAGLLVMTVGLWMLTAANSTSPLWYLWIAMFLVGGGQGAAMQNLVLAVQNTVPLRDLGASTATVVFFRSLGGAVGVQIGGFVFTHSVTIGIARGFAEAGLPIPAHVSAGASMSFEGLSAQAEQIIRNAYGSAVGHIFLTMAVLGLVAVVLAALMSETTLRDEVD